MPVLETMEIWQTCTNNESIFRYEARPEPTVTFLSRFDMTAMWTEEAQAAWEKAAQKNTSRPLIVRFETLPPWPENFRGEFYVYGTITHLNLRDLVIDPVSLYAAVWEESPVPRPQHHHQARQYLLPGPQVPVLANIGANPF